MAEEDVAKLFHDFVRIKNSKTKKHYRNRIRTFNYERYC